MVTPTSLDPEWMSYQVGADFCYCSTIKLVSSHVINRVPQSLRAHPYAGEWRTSTENAPIPTEYFLLRSIPLLVTVTDLNEDLMRL